MLEAVAYSRQIVIEFLNRKATIVPATVLRAPVRNPLALCPPATATASGAAAKARMVSPMDTRMVRNVWTSSFSSLSKTSVSTSP